MWCMAEVYGCLSFVLVWPVVGSDDSVCIADEMVDSASGCAGKTES